MISDKENVCAVILSEFKEEKHFDDNQFMTQMYVVIKDDDVRYEYMKNVSNVCCHYRWQRTLITSKYTLSSQNKNLNK